LARTQLSVFVTTTFRRGKQLSARRPGRNRRAQLLRGKRNGRVGESKTDLAKIRTSQPVSAASAGGGLARRAIPRRESLPSPPPPPLPSLHSPRDNFANNVAGALTCRPIAEKTPRGVTFLTGKPDGKLVQVYGGRREGGGAMRAAKLKERF